jgi:sarcosine oxidase subunit gamma
MFDGAAITIGDGAPRSVAGIAGYRDRAALVAALELEFGVSVPAGSAFVRAAGVTLSCVAPARYVAAGDRAAGLPARLGASLANVAAVTDQSDLWQVFEVSGAGTGEMLSRVVPVDLAPEVFPVGALALTRAGHLNVRLWHIDVQTYEIAVSRSYAEDLRHALEQAK